MSVSKPDFRIRQDNKGLYYVEKRKWHGWERVDMIEWGDVYSAEFKTIEEAEDFIRTLLPKKPDPVVKEVYSGLL